MGKLRRNAELAVAGAMLVLVAGCGTAEAPPVGTATAAEGEAAAGGQTVADAERRATEAEAEASEARTRATGLEEELATAESKLAELEQELEDARAELEADPSAAQDEDPPEDPEASGDTTGSKAESGSLTVSQENAVRSARSYLDFTAFSRSGLIGQLEFEGYSTQDATVAVDSLDIDYREQAAKASESYLEFSGFSRSGLIDQLMFEGYTKEQATYGVDQTGL